MNYNRYNVEKTQQREMMKIRAIMAAGAILAALAGWFLPVVPWWI